MFSLSLSLRQLGKVKRKRFAGLCTALSLCKLVDRIPAMAASTTELLYTPFHLLSLCINWVFLVIAIKMQLKKQKLFLPISLLLLVFVFPAARTDLDADRAALLALRSAVGGRTILLWSATDGNTCSWPGVLCEGNRVTVIRLPGVSLSGEIPTGILGNLTELRTLSLRLNALTGQLPSDLVACTNLRNLYLQGNSFTGEIPGFLFELHELVRLNLASNNFSGEIPLSLNNLKRLKTLYIENNQFRGSIGGLNLESVEQFNASNNLLNGSIPTSLHKFSSSSFMGNSLCGTPLQACDGTGENIGIGDGDAMGKKKKLSGGAIAGIIIGSVVGFILILLLIMLLCRKKSSKKTSSVDMAVAKQPEAETPGGKPAEEVENGGFRNGQSILPIVGNSKEESKDVGGAKRLVFFGNADKGFDLEDLLRASAEVLGKGTFGTSYKAVMEVGATVAVKRLKDVTISEREFREKIEIVGRMDHPNLVPLRAYYFSREEKLLVCDFMAMGSLSALLHGNKESSRAPLNWEMRSNVAMGAARGIAYLHSQGSNVCHGNIKSSNVLLTSSFDGKVSDFGLAHLVGTPSTPNRVDGYRAPEVTDPRKVSQKADVYGFGILLLELLTGKPPTHAVLNEEGVDLPRWVQSVVREKWTSEVFDLELLRYQNVEGDMVQMLQLAVDCAAQYPDNRPSMAEVTKRIEELSPSTLAQDSNMDPPSGDAS